MEYKLIVAENQDDFNRKCNAATKDGWFANFGVTCTSVVIDSEIVDKFVQQFTRSIPVKT